MPRVLEPAATAPPPGPISLVQILAVVLLWNAVCKQD
jgi:hypothetical protein